MNFTVKTAAAPLYAKPDKKSQWLDEVLHGMTVTAELDKGEWLYVRTSYRYMGWIERRHLYKAGPGFDHYITVFAADVLAAPKVQAALLICLTLGCVVRVIKEEVPGWTKIALADDSTGYVRSAFLAPIIMPGTIKEAKRDIICQTAKLYMDVQYRWGGKTPYGIDCSGLCFMAYWLNGIIIYRDACIKPDFSLKEISPNEAQKGDLLFFPGHVGMFLGEDLMIHSSEAGCGVKIEPLTSEWKSRITAAAGQLLSS